MPLYSAELYYLQDQKDFPFQKALLVTSTTVVQWCHYFDAEIIAPKTNHITPKRKSGALPASSTEKDLFIADLLHWLLEHSLSHDLFRLLLDTEPIHHQKTAKFNHPDDTCCWTLNLSEEEFKQLQQQWQNNNLPPDLFFPADQTICIPWPGSGWRSKILRFLGAKKCYTPQQWKQEQQMVE